MFPPQGQIAAGMIKEVTVTIAANAISGSAAHSLGTTPKVSRPNPSDIAANGNSSADATNVTVTLDAPQPSITTHTVLCFVGV